MTKLKGSFLGKRIVVFTAHPDDEQLAAGTMYKNHQMGGETFLLCATSGEKGKSHLAKPVSDAALARLRRNELLKVAKVLKIDNVIFLGFPDANVRKNEKQLYEKSLPIIAKIKPEYILSFGPDGMSGHWDHITAGKVALRIAKKLKIPLAAFTMSAASRKARMKFVLARRKFGSYAGIPKHRKGDITIKIDGAVKRRAMRHHVSQFGGATPFAGLPKVLRDKIFSYEHFVLEKI
jgi:LmbE family N-acetylglucosaminyl deacetylase